MTEEKRMGEGFRRLLWRRRFGAEEFQTPDPLNEYDDDYAALKEENDAGDDGRPA